MKRMRWNDNNKTSFLLELLLSVGSNRIFVDMTSSVGYRQSPACYMLQLVVMMAEASRLPCFHIV